MSKTMISLGIIGSTGRMGKTIQKLLDQPDFSDFSLKASFTGKEPLTQDNLKNIDVIIDFSQPEALSNWIPLAVEVSIPMIIGTTGFSDAQRNTIENAAHNTAVLLASNTSVGVNVLMQLVNQAAELLPKEFSSHVTEMHHVHKKDAPSGTALSLKEQVTAAQKGAQVSVDSIRAGDITGEHTVFFVSEGERIELTHKATSRDIFARGALQAARFISNKKAGLYTMQDVLKGDHS